MKQCCEHLVSLFDTAHTFGGVIFLGGLLPRRRNLLMRYLTSPALGGRRAGLGDLLLNVTGLLLLGAVIVLAVVGGLLYVAVTIPAWLFGSHAPLARWLSQWVLLLGFPAAAGWLLWKWGRRRRSHVRRLQDLFALTPADFEIEVANLFTDLGCRHVKRVGQPGDLAADLTCTDREGRRVVVQCKRYAPGTSVGSPDVQTFIGMIAVHHRADHGVFVTTTDFTDPAHDLAARHGIELIAGQRLGALLDQGYPPPFEGS